MTAAAGRSWSAQHGPAEAAQVRPDPPLAHVFEPVRVDEVERGRVKVKVELGWVRISGFWAGLALCAEHAETVHVPAAATVGAAVQVRCGCGTSADLGERPNGFFARGWWQGHVAG